ncbi:MAG: C4-dicarboxylate ABC transporter [Planctomycetota bacterium]|nr:MAG: C4-dicarboxylate ABC transporter [Planctomycetota bacterium]
MELTQYLPLLMFVFLFIGIMSGYPVAFVLGGVSIVFGFVGYSLEIFRLNDLNLIANRTFGVMTNVPLIAVPLFAFMGNIMEKSGLAGELLEAMGQLFQKAKGGLFFSVLVVGMVLAASTGIIGATVVSMGVIALPTMLKHNYNKEMSCGIIAASGTLGQIIPPSIVLILLGSIMQVDVGSLFTGAVIPGLLLVGLYALYIFIRTCFNSELAPAIENKDSSKFSILTFLKLSLPPGLLVVIVLGSIVGGMATPTEAAACGAFGGIVITMIKRKFTIQVLMEALKSTSTLTSMVFLILICAQFFGIVFRGLEGDELIINSIKEVDLTASSVVIIVMILMFFLGFFLDFIEICFIVIPIVYPIFLHYEIDLLWLSILMAVNLQTSFLTPPFGFALFYLKGVAPEEIETKHIYKGVLPFIGLQVIAILLLYFIPELTTWLPGIVYSE